MVKYLTFLLRIEKLSKLSEMIDGYINIARKLSRQFDIVLAKELFSSFVIKGFDVHLIVSLGGNDVKSIPNEQYRIYSIEKQILHLFKERKLEFNVLFY